tara:strand:+ start:1161 stop:1565 length:405 start_codon:yes stop_codon:yes gene_type:complete
MDLSTIDLKTAAAEGIVVKLQHPATGEYIRDDAGDHVSITVLGKDSEQWQACAKRTNAKNAARYKNKTIPSAALEAALYDILADCTVCWSEKIEYEGKKLKCNAENARMLYESRNWIAEQLIEAAADRSSYFLK